MVYCDLTLQYSFVDTRCSSPTVDGGRFVELIMAAKLNLSIFASVGVMQL